MSRGQLRRYFRPGLLQQLLVFNAVASLGTLTRAAEELHLAQPTVSVQLKKLAVALDVVLFETHGRCLRLTAAGIALRESCAEIIGCLGRAELRLAPWRAPATEHLMLAAEPEARAVASRLIAAFCSRHPCVQASLHIAGRDALLARFASGVDDVYVFALDVDGLPGDRRWSIAHSKRRDLAETAAQFLREALVDDSPTIETASREVVHPG